MLRFQLDSPKQICYEEDHVTTSLMPATFFVFFGRDLLNSIAGFSGFKLARPK